MAWHLNMQRVEIIGRHWLIGEFVRVGCGPACELQ